MEDFNKRIFESLFRKACEKCFGHTVDFTLTETDSKLLSNKILEQTGLVIGAKSIKNYSRYLISERDEESTGGNPNVATLDTFARYVMGAPYTTEIQRKDHESHYPYWHRFKSDFIQVPEKKPRISRRSMKISFLVISLAMVLTSVFVLYRHFFSPAVNFQDDFNSVSSDSLKASGWLVSSIDSTWWNRRNEMPGHLTLYTLRGDNWNLKDNHARIPNLLTRKIGSECFAAEIHFTEFIPLQNWQQAGIILSEDSFLKGKMIRFSIAYNDFFGGFEKPAEIILQAFSSSDGGAESKPEEIIHQPLFILREGEKELAIKNLKTSALKIEKRGNSFKFLYSVSPSESFSFQKAFESDFTMSPRYISIFSIRGWAEGTELPACVDWIRVTSLGCKQ